MRKYIKCFLIVLVLAFLINTVLLDYSIYKQTKIEDSLLSVKRNNAIKDLLPLIVEYKKYSEDKDAANRIVQVSSSRDSEEDKDEEKGSRRSRKIRKKISNLEGDSFKPNNALLEKSDFSPNELQKIHREIQGKIEESPEEPISVLVKPEDYKEEFQEFFSANSVQYSQIRKLADEKRIESKIEGAEGKISLRTREYLGVEIEAGKLKDIVSDEHVEKIYPDREYYSALDTSVGMINAQALWDSDYKGSGIKIAVLDTGIDPNHPMISGKIIAEEIFTGEANAYDTAGHGTQIAGIAAGRNNGEGISGVAPEASLINAKVLDDHGSGTTIGIIAGIEWAVDPDNNPDTDDGADIITMSLGAAYSDPDTPLKGAIEYAISRGVVVIVSAGNCGSDCPSAGCGSFTGVTIPGTVEEAITVGAVDDNRNIACFSSGQDFGYYIKPDVVAPGVDITTSAVGGGYNTVSGTSMSAPHVAGVAALLLEMDESLDHYGVKNLLESNAVDFGEEGKDVSYGSGFVDLSVLFVESGQENETDEPDNESDNIIELNNDRIIYSNMGNFEFIAVKNVSVQKSNSLSDKIAIYSNENGTVYVEAIIFDNAFDLIDYLYKTIPLTSQEELDFILYDYSYIEYDNKTIWYTNRSVYLVKNPHELDIKELLDTYSAFTSNHVGSNFEENIKSLRELDEESIRIISLRNSQDTPEFEKALVYSPSWGGPTPGDAYTITFGKDYSETFWTEKAYNWYYTSTARRGTLTFGIRDIDSGDDLDIYVYDYQADNLLCYSYNSGNSDEECTVEKNSDITWGFYILVYPYTIDGSYVEANIYTEAEDCDEKWLNNYECRSDVVYREWQNIECTTPMKEYEDCDDYDSPGSWSSPFCSDGDIKKKITSYDYYCSSGSCSSSENTQYSTVEYCDYGCSGSSCYECTSDSHCGSYEKCSSHECVDKTCSDLGKPKTCNYLAYIAGWSECNPLGADGDPTKCEKFGGIYCYDYLDNCDSNEYCDENGAGDSKCSAYQCTVTSSSWDKENAVEGDIVTLTANGDHCTGKTAKFEIWESDCPGFDFESTSIDGLEEQDMVIQKLEELNETGNFTAQNWKDYCPYSHLVDTINNVGFSSNKFQTTWTTKYEDDVIGNPDYYFNVIVDGNELSSSSNYLRVSKRCTDNDGDGYGNPASSTCAHSELDCKDDNANVNPGKTETCNGVDDNCKDGVDEGFDKQNDKNNCGSCGNICSVSHANEGCSSGDCYIESCNSGYSDCDNSYSNGCEININTNVDNCGSCGNICSVSHANEGCSSGDCYINSCEDNYGDCDSIYNNGCEVNFIEDRNNCGSCGNVCGSNQLCISAQCVIQEFCGDGTCQSDEDEYNCPGDCVHDCDMPDGFNWDCDCDSDSDCRVYGDYHCNQVSGPDGCEEINYQDECFNYNDYFCESGDVYQCVSNSKYYEKELIERCGFGGRYCDSSVVDGTGACSQHPNQMDVWVDYAGTGVEVNKQRGDKLRFNIYTKYDTDVSIWYDTSVFSGDCVIGSMGLSAGVNSCDLTVKNDARYDRAEIKVDNDNVAVVNVLSYVNLLVVTDSEKLYGRYPHEENGVKAVLRQAYANAEDLGVVYDLSWYNLGVANPFGVFSSYNERITQPYMTDNSYSLAVSEFIKDKCNYCEDVMIVGDDYVVPGYRRDIGMYEGYLWWKDLESENIYTDQAYVQNTFKPLSEVEDLLKEKQDIKIIIDPVLQSSLYGKVEELRDLISSKYPSSTEIIDSDTIGCNSFSQLDDSTLIIIGSEENNAVRCHPFVSKEDSYLSISNNIWDTKHYSILLNPTPEKYDNLLALYNIIDNGPDPDWDYDNVVVACLWSGKFGGAVPTAKEVTCNMIPLVELAPDIRDSWKCLFSNKDEDTNEGVVSYFVCSVVHLATGYDLATWGAAIFTFGATGAGGEVFDGGIAVLKVFLKETLPNIVEGVGRKVVKDAAETIVAAPKLLVSLGELVWKFPSKIPDMIEGGIQILKHGPEVSESAFSTLKRWDFDFSKDAIKGAGNIEDLKIKRLYVIAIDGEFTTAGYKFFGDDKVYQNIVAARKGLENDFKDTRIIIGEIQDPDYVDAFGYFDEATDEIILNANRLSDSTERIRDYTIFHEHGHKLRNIVTEGKLEPRLRRLFPDEDTITLLKIKHFTEFDDTWRMYNFLGQEAEAYKTALRNFEYGDNFRTTANNWASAGYLNKELLARKLAETEKFGLDNEYDILISAIDNKIGSNTPLKEWIIETKNIMINSAGHIGSNSYDDALKSVYTQLTSEV